MIFGITKLGVGVMIGNKSPSLSPTFSRSKIGVFARLLIYPFDVYINIDVFR